jgi:hypothetical protein
MIHKWSYPPRPRRTAARKRRLKGSKRALTSAIPSQTARAGANCSRGVDCEKWPPPKHDILIEKLDVGAGCEARCKRRCQERMANCKGRYLLGGCSSLFSHPIALLLLKGSRESQSGQRSARSPLVLGAGVAINFAPHFGQVSRSICPIARSWCASDDPSIPKGIWRG